MKKITIRLNVPLKTYPAGYILVIDADDEGTPLDNYWYRRFKDAPIDNCITVLENNNKKKKDAE